MNILLRVFCMLAIGSLYGLPLSATAASKYPDHPVKMIVGFAPGGAADFLGRTAAHALTDGLGQQVVVENRPGAGGLIATNYAAKTTPDGYTLLFTSIPHVINPHLRKVEYDPVKSFEPVIQFVSVPLVLAVNPQLSVHSVKDLIDYAKARPGKINYASAGSGSSSHLAMELLKEMAGVKLNHIPYKGTGALLPDLIAGRVSATIASAVPLIPQIRNGKLRGLATTGPKRSAAIPDLPTIAATVPGYEVINWFGVLAPAGTPKPIVARLNEVLNKALQQPRMVKLLNARGADVVGGTPDEFARVIKADYVKWGKIVKESGAHVD
ncbi:MAG TPA: tripartite tricarboxylate transporter substrate binding protein [Burkholderiales bacterium]|nr:tripartite tricarboxylate transporter substrate binding protein [Burkholderiales bacterium]